MKIVGVRWQSFRIPLRQPFVTALGILGAREGLIIVLETDDGHMGLGEASPLPTARGPLLEGAAAEIAAVAPQLLALTPQAALRALSRLVGSRGLSAAVRCGVDIALHDLRAKEVGLPLCHLLASQPAAAVPVNAVLGAASADALVQAAQAAVANGFTTLKIKVATTNDLRQEIERVRAVRQAAGPGVRIRLDANGGWNRPTAIAALKTLVNFDIELVEQPVPPHDLHGMARVRSETGVPVAADEAVTDEESAHRLLAAAAVDFLVIKPMVLGGLTAAIQVIAKAQQAGVGSIVTTTIDTGVGTAAALHLAAAHGSPGLPCGLATADLLEATLVTSLPKPCLGAIAVPARLGLGVELNEEALQKYGAAILGGFYA